MSPEVTQRKIEHLAGYWRDLRPFKNCSFETYRKNHYVIERILELSIVVVIDLAFHLLSKQGEPTPSSYSAALMRIGELKFIPLKLAERLSKAAGLRNALAHGYEDLDEKKVYQSINKAISDLAIVIQIFEKS